jgi:protein-L-isoaspartate(D-aspartate) O-methyltransferase
MVMDFAAARHRMVENQIRPNRIVDPLVIEAMGAVPREAFLPVAQRGIAYVDEDIPLGDGRYLTEPLVTAQLLQAAEITADCVVLIVGGGPGYIAALAARMASAVIMTEDSPELAARANEVLGELSVLGVTVVTGPLAAGLPDQAPYDVILFGGAVHDVPPAFGDQLTEGGRIVAVVASEHGLGKGTVMLKMSGVLSRRVAFDAATPLLPAFTPQPAFRF